jgi:Organic solute transporter Ostalpha
MGSPMPKFLCVKGILFFSFWQATGVSLLASVGVIRRLGPYTDKEHISLGLTDTLICLEMPFFAIAHFAAFSQRDYVDKKLTYVGRMPMRHAFQDSFGFKDVFEDAIATLNGQGMDYREFEPSEGHMHQGLGRERRIRAGLRYSHGGRGKYWLPQSAAPSRWERSPEGGISAPLLSEDVEDAIQDPSDNVDESSVAVGFDLPFGGYDSEDEELFASSRKYLFGDYNYPCIDASSEVARAKMWEEEERILNNERSAWFSDHHGHHGRGAIAVTGYGAVGVSQPQQTKSHTLVTPLSPSATIDPEPTHGPVRGHSDAQLRWANVFWPKFRLKSPPNPGNPRISPISTEISATGPVARPDAVDLVTEDHRTADIAMSPEHHQGERASGDVTTQTHHLFGNPGPDMVANVHIRDKGNDSHADAEGMDTSSDSETNKTATRVDSPQPLSRTRGLVNIFDDLEGDENPWA